MPTVSKLVRITIRRDDCATPIHAPDSTPASPTAGRSR
jgi:hypothetical protein